MRAGGGASNVKGEGLGFGGERDSGRGTARLTDPRFDRLVRAREEGSRDLNDREGHSSRARRKTVVKRKVERCTKQ
jgi:hypothetical protein